MKRTLITSLIAALSGLAIAAYAAESTVVVWEAPFDTDTNNADGTYGAHLTDFGSSPPAMGTNTLVAPGYGATGQMMQLEYTEGTGAGNNLNLQFATREYAANGLNTNLYLANYYLEFDAQVIGLDPPFGYQCEVSVFGPGSWIWNGDASHWEIGWAQWPTNGQGWKHFKLSLGDAAPNTTALVPTDASFSVGYGMLSFPGVIATNEIIDIDNCQITMITNPQPPPHPTMEVLPAKPGVRIFAQNFAAPWNQEGFAASDPFQGWVSGTYPVSYAITFQDFDTVDGYSLYAQFVPGSPINPYIVYSYPNALTWTITHQAGGFTTSVAWKTNLANSGSSPNVALASTATSSLDGRGTWTLTFTSPTDGSVTPPVGPALPFTLPPEMTNLFVDPVTLAFGTAPNGSGGYGQYIDIGRITITGVAGANEDDDFTTDSSFNTDLWDRSFSLDGASAVVQVSTDTPFWVKWTIPDNLFGLGDKLNLADNVTVWHSLQYWNADTPTTTQMGPLWKWTLVHTDMLPTVNGQQGGSPSTAIGFFKLAKPAPSP